MSAVTVHKVCFSLDGEFLTEHCRSLWAREDRQDLAFKTLKTGLMGITDEQVLSILDGRFKLVGDSNDPEGIQMVKDTAQGPDLLATIQKLKQERDDAQDEAADLVQMSIGDTVDLPSPGGLRKVPRRKTEVRGDPSGSRRVLKRGYDWPDQPKRTRTKGSKPLRIYQEKERSFYLDYQDERPEREEVEEATLPPPPDPHDSLTSDFGWLSPEGAFYPCGYGDHIFTARCLDSTEPELERKGWVKVCKSMNGDQHFFFLADPPVRPTEVQAKRVTDYCLTNHHDVPYWAKDNE